MSDDWKDALVEKMAQAISREDCHGVGDDSDLSPQEAGLYARLARAAIAVALPEIAERAAMVAEDAVAFGLDAYAIRATVAAAIRKLGEEG